MAGEEAEYDLVVIGGGSGGMACAKEASRLGARVLLLEYGAPSHRNTPYGPGAWGCCVTAGCVPKYLFHQSALLGESLDLDSRPSGWCSSSSSFDWNTLASNVQSTIKKLRFEYRKSLSSSGVEHIIAKAWMHSDTCVRFRRNKDNSESSVDCKNVLISVGGRPEVPGSDALPGAELCITSDDLFWMKSSPGKTLVVGGGYVALECAGFLNGTHHEVTVAVRSVALRGFDRQCADKVVQLEREAGVKFRFGTELRRIDLCDNDRRKVTFSDNTIEVYDTVMLALGRKPATSELQLERAGVQLSFKGKVVGDLSGRTHAPHLFAVGDVLDGNFELTPVAIKQGELLARRLFGSSTEEMSSKLVPTTIFTPTEYSKCGLSEEEAYEHYGYDDVEVYLSEFQSLEMMLTQRRRAPQTITEEQEEVMDVERSPECLAKVVCLRSQNERIIGLHFIGPKAGEVMQMGAVAMRMGATKAALDDSIAIHPTIAEAFTGMSVTRRSGKSYTGGSCGGGKCG